MKSVPMTIALVVSERLAALDSQVEELTAVERNLASAANSCKLALEFIKEDRRLMVEWAQRVLTDEELSSLDIRPIPF